MPDTCTDCGWCNTGQPRPRRLLPVLSEDGATLWCACCVAVMVLEAEPDSYHVAVVMSRTPALV